jgi:hypothetical protein
MQQLHVTSQVIDWGKNNVNAAPHMGLHRIFRPTSSGVTQGYHTADGMEPA